MNDILKGIINHYNTNYSLTNKPVLYTILAGTNAEYPYITLDIISIINDDTLTENQEKLYIQFNIFDNNNSIENINNIYNELIKIFDFANIEITGYNCILCRRDIAQLIKENEVFQYNVNFEITLEKI